ncbi:5'-3' exoribonuclease 2-like isoform X3 [Ruditapes philippinarum]|uniref:5'-3' exoribonuclease 2-like isoform X3 n=1 Tax=Ruditapes philippinarum TaxID=129788 RepID=UPI00295AF06B|nr:5'-3' exoribonuclease 2-like isoform X3 [Ruditapes philippinarum]
MGVPAFFRWLSRKYPSIVVHCVEEKTREVNGVKFPVDSSQPNPNDTEFDNLYLDMNGIIHPCTHPEDKPAPKNEEEMMILIFEYIDRIFSIVRPRRVLYMAIDGVAPRAKMNQQRSRRFRASKEAVETAEEISRVREELLLKGCSVPPEKPASEKFDSNCITPGTPFMFRLANCLRFYIHDRLNNDAGWKGIKVILSDANVPGEGEHKIMDFIRKQRAQPDHDPNTKHCLCGADADLIMLGLATHEPYFTIIREEFKPNKPRPCSLCGQIGHELKECQGIEKEKSGEFDQKATVFADETPFIFLRLNILREYLERELLMNGLPFPYDFERALDDWVFMCFFVGNDFLPHLPSLEIREGAIDRLIKLYKNAVRRTGGYLTDSGVVALERVQLIMQELGEVEDEIFKKRRDDEMNFRRRNKEKRRRNRRFDDKPRYIPGGMLAPQPLGRGRPGVGAPSGNVRQEAYQQRMQNFSTSSSDRDLANLDAAQALKAMMNSDNNERGEKRKRENMDSDSDPEPEDDVKLWEDGWKDRYYKNKFDVGSEDIAFRHNVANHYVRGLCWVLRYYYQGCASWKWYFPYHYAPFASDFVNVAALSNDFEKDTEPFKPLEQLMGVFPAGSKQHVPPTWQELMTDPKSPIIDFYPINFKIDLNGKKYAWQGVALLPFVDEKRLWKALDKVYPDLTDAEIKRNIRGSDRLFVSQSHSVHAFLEALYEEDKSDKTQLEVNPSQAQGMAGKVWQDEFVYLTGETVKSPLPQLADLEDNRVVSVQYCDPMYKTGFHFQAKVLPGAVMPDKVLKPEDFDKFNRGNQYRPQLGFQRDSGYRGRRDMGPANRMISDDDIIKIHMHLWRGGANIAPPSSYGNQGGYNQNNRGGVGGYNRGGYSGGYGARQGGNQGSYGYQNNQSGAMNSFQRNTQAQSGGYSRHNQGGGASGYGNGNRNTYGGSYSGSYSTGNQGGGGGGGGSQYGGSYSTSQGGSGGGNRNQQGDRDNRYGNNNNRGYPMPPGYRR